MTTADTGQAYDGQRPTVLFICVRNGGKSQMAAGLMRKLAGETIAVYSAGTDPGTKLNSESVTSLQEVGADLNGEHPKPVTPELLATADHIILLGEEVQLNYQPTADQVIERWVTDEPSFRGITGMERMRLIRDDIQQHLHQLLQQVHPTSP